MIRGMAVDVLRPVAGATDRFGLPTETYATPETVDDVLVAPGAAADMEAARPDGVVVALTLHFPKGYTSSLRGCKVVVGAPYSGTYRVIGDPQPYMDENTPTRWNRPVEVEAADG